ncbi:hypothetical protein ASG12_06545 [Williamsia sp. Leaf354]|uniref:DUF2231 domain-containing protein n=1 Tax=Williamsia sp. Leaf354 TaxID=1736349 RepID=UPI0006F3D2E3|nr:DUF2231 domain-containing protein [Williamsia sp. Leaf354]KQS00538.1 hypothetical protein ASG12_06545 [Williamsia sp. Leaf354]
MDSFNGLPLHPLVVHIVVVMIPLAAVFAVLGVVWPAARRKLGIVTPIVAAIALTATPIATSAGESLEKKTPPSAVLERHTELGDQMIYFAAPLFVLAVLWWVHTSAWFRENEWVAGRVPALTRGRSQTVITGVLAVLLVVVAVGAVIWVYRIGDAGARSVWGG